MSNKCFVLLISFAEWNKNVNVAGGVGKKKQSNLLSSSSKEIINDISNGPNLLSFDEHDYRE